MADLERDVRRLARQSDDRLLDEADRSDEAGAKRRAQFAKQTKKTLAVTDIEIPNNYPPVADYDKFLALVEDIRANDIKQRIEVTERRGRYVLEHGRARLEVAKRLKHETIKVIVLGECQPVAVKKSKPRAPLPNEWDLVQQARAGDIDARDTLLDHYYWLAVSLAYKGRRKMEREEASGVAFDAIDKAIATWDPRRAKLSTWIGEKIQGELTTQRRNLRKQSADGATWIEPERWIHRNRKNTKVVPLDNGLVRIERLDDPTVYTIAEVKKRKYWTQDPLVSFGRNPSRIVQIENDERKRRQELRARYDRIARIIGEDRIGKFLKSRKGNAFDQKIARMALVDRIGVEWEEKIGRKKYRAWIFPPTKPDIYGTPVETGTGRLPSEIAHELGITISKVDASLARTIKAITGKSEKQLIAEDGERAARVQAIPVPAPNLPRKVQRELKLIGPEPTAAEAARVVCRYWLDCVHVFGLRDRPDTLFAFATHIVDPDAKIGDLFSMRGAGLPGYSGKELLIIADRVADVIRDNPPAHDYARICECVAIIKRQS